MKKRLGILVAIAAAGLLIVGINSYLIDYANKYNARTCTAQPIPYTSSSVDDPNVDAGTNTISTVGVNGEKNVCVNDFGTVMSDTVTMQPVSEVVSHGTKPPSALYVAPESQGGSICNDGTYSASVGRGTCSWHGGVDHYL